MTPQALIHEVALAIAEFEGFNMTAEKWIKQGKKLPQGWQTGDPITIAQRHNNPGNIRSWHGVPTVNKYAKFDSAIKGWAALHSQTRYNIFGRIGIDPYPLRTKEPCTFFTFFAGQRTESGAVKEGGYPGFAPADDSNHPRKYAEFVLDFLKKGSLLTSASAEVKAGLTINTVIRSLETLA